MCLEKFEAERAKVKAEAKKIMEEEEEIPDKNENVERIDIDSYVKKMQEKASETIGM
jgi:hypothetical protein